MSDDQTVEAAHRSEVAESFRYARSFYDGAEATGPAEFERNRQAIIDVIALAYRDGKASARASESALRAAAQEERVLELVSKYVAIGDYWHARGLKSWPIDATVLDRFARASLSILGNAPSSPDMALRAAAQAVIVRGSLVGRCLECWQTDGAHTDKCDLGRLKAALDGAPWEPSEELVERVAIAVWRERVNEGLSDKTPPEQWAPPFTWESVHPHNKEVKYYPVARAALKAAMGIESGSAG